MRYRPLGRTGEQVSVISLGSGGRRRLGQDRGASQDETTRLVRTALDAGINLFDTAPAYGDSEAILGRALAGVARTSYLLATKVTVTSDGRLHEPDDIDRSVTRSLRRLGTDHVDVLQLHGVRPAHYHAVADRLLPVVEARRDRGDARFVGVTEASRLDPDHAMLSKAVDDGRFDTVMVAYSMGSPAAGQTVLPVAEAAGIGVIVMTAVAPGVAAADAYRFAAAHPSVATVLTGTADAGHLAENIAAVLEL